MFQRRESAWATTSFGILIYACCNFFLGYAGDSDNPGLAELRVKVAEMNSAWAASVNRACIKPWREHAWNGKQLLIWDGTRCVAYTPRLNTWKLLPQNYTIENSLNFNICALIAIGNDIVLGAHSDGQKVYLSGWRSDGHDGWLSITNQDSLGGIQGADGRMIRSLYGIGGTSSGHLFLLSRESLVGFRIDQDLRTQPLSPPMHFEEAMLVRSEKKMVFYGHDQTRHPSTWVCDMDADDWKEVKCEDVSPSAIEGFGFAAGGSYAMVYGGKLSGGRGWTVSDGFLLCTKSIQWQPIEVKDGPGAIHNFAFCWMGGESFFLFGGIYGRPGGGQKAIMAKGTLLDHTFTYDSKIKQWKQVLSRGAPSGRFGSLCVWTGTEVMVWGGRTYDQVLEDGYLYNPRENEWRKIAELPKFNVPIIRQDNANKAPLFPKE